MDKLKNSASPSFTVNDVIKSQYKVLSTTRMSSVCIIFKKYILKV